MCAHAGQETIPGTPISLDFGSASVSGAGKLIRTTNVPVIVGGTIFYFNVDFDLVLLSNGALVANPINLAQASGPAIAPAQSTLDFQPGTYSFPIGTTTTCTLTLSTPSIGDDGRRQYVFVPTAAATASCNFDVFFGRGGTWATGPAQGNPLITGLLNTTFLQSAPSDRAYGVATGGGAGTLYTVTASQTASAVTLTVINANGGVIRTQILTKQ